MSSTARFDTATAVCPGVSLAAIAALYLGPRRAVVALGVQREELERHAVDAGVDAADETPDLPAGEALHGLAELPDGRVLEEDPRLAEALMLSQSHEVPLGRRQRLLERHRDRIRPCPGGSRLRGPAPEQRLVEMHHLVRDRHRQALRGVGAVDARRRPGSVARL